MWGGSNAALKNCLDLGGKGAGLGTKFMHPVPLASCLPIQPQLPVIKHVVSQEGSSEDAD
jgi:hypothetical protein